MIDIYRRLAYQLGRTPQEIENIYKAYWKCIKYHIERLPLKTDMTEEEFKKMKTSFSLKFLGKIACTYDKFKKVKKNLKRHESTSKNKTNG